MQTHDPKPTGPAPEVHAVRFQTDGDICLAADIAGEPWHPRLIFLHGGGQSRRSWRSALHSMVHSGFSAVSYDLRGYGESSWSQSGDYDLDANVRDLKKVIRASPNRPALIGASFGGRVALAAAAELGPEAVGALVLVDMTPRVARPGIERVGRFLQQSRAGFASIEEAVGVLEAYAERRIGHNYFRVSHSVRTGDDGRIYWRWDPRVAEDDVLFPHGIEDRLTEYARRLACPTLLVRGTESDVVDADCAAHFRTVRPDAEVVDLEGAGHLMQASHPEVFCEATLSFLHREFASGA